ncbi:hypothetical protein E308F_27480 [Moorella sp. E308F]|jgi:tRNA(fMet)-specific endonuclease VapC|nr:hypothetical protein E308F_27480 [Moorella sp. E308F]GEA17319.1 hypothetical protein E306M_04530 [Moorella sp. E306M]
MDSISGRVSKMTAVRLPLKVIHKGYSLSIADVTNAALAISRKLVLVTRNTKHYPFEQLLIKSW